MARTEERRVSLEVERLRTQAIWDGQAAEFLPLAVAAAIAFHQVHGSARAIVSFDDYNDALNIAASALSRLVPLFNTRADGVRAVIAVDLTRQHFTRGATRLMRRDGGSIADLYVRRSDMRSAVSLIRRAGLPFSFAILPEDERRLDPHQEGRHADE